MARVPVDGGAADAGIWQKMVYAERLAQELRMPLVRLVDGTGGGGSVKSLEDMGHTYVPFIPGWELAVENLSTVPVVAAALGPVAGLGAARVVASHFSVIVRDSAQLFVAGPPVVAAAMGESPDKEELGGARAQTRAGDGGHVVQVDGRGLLEADLGADHDLARHPSDGRRERRDGDGGEAADHVLARQDEHRAPAIGAWKRELPDLAARYFGHRCAPSTGPNSSSATGCRA